MSFVLDPRLEADSRPVATLDLCEARLIDNAHYPWLILVPRRADCQEILNLAPDDRRQLWAEVERAGAALLWSFAGKLNIGQLGNVVPQLHLHLVVRTENDAAWPGPVWGGPRIPYTDDAAAERVAILRRLLAS